MAVKIFYSYAHEDKGYRETLEKHLSTLKQSALIAEWSDRNINAAFFPRILRRKGCVDGDFSPHIPFFSLLSG
jgi:hypothetical protein